MENTVKQISQKIILAAAAFSLIAGAASCGPKEEKANAKAPIARSAFERDDDMSIGDPNAPVTIVEYASLTCPHCAVFHKMIFPQIKETYVDTGKVRFVFRQFPTAPAQLAVGGEAVARCKGPDTYFELLGLLFEKQEFWLLSQNPGQALRDLGAMYGITPAEFDACIADTTNITRMQDVMDHARETWGLDATPRFIINGKLAEDLIKIEDFTKLIDETWAEATKGESKK